MVYRTIMRWLPLLIIIALLALFFMFDLNRYISFDTLQLYRKDLLNWTANHYLTAVVVFMAIYALAVAVSIPGAALFTITGGFLFGNILGTIYVIISATIGATLLFLAVRMALAKWVQRTASIWIIRMRKGFNDNAFQYLLSLRLIPVIPFWVVNIVPAALGVQLKTYILATFLGIILGSFVYVTIGNGLGHLFDLGQTPDLGIIFEPQILLPLIGLAVLSFIPSIYKSLKDKKAKRLDL